MHELPYVCPSICYNVLTCDVIYFELFFLGAFFTNPLNKKQCMMGYNMFTIKRKQVLFTEIQHIYSCFAVLSISLRFFLYPYLYLVIWSILSMLRLTKNYFYAKNRVLNNQITRYKVISVWLLMTQRFRVFVRKTAT